MAESLDRMKVVRKADWKVECLAEQMDLRMALMMVDSKVGKRGD